MGRILTVIGDNAERVLLADSFTRLRIAKIDDCYRRTALAALSARSEQPRSQIGCPSSLYVWQEETSAELPDLSPALQVPRPWKGTAARGVSQGS